MKLYIVIIVALVSHLNAATSGFVAREWGVVDLPLRSPANLLTLPIFHQGLPPGYQTFRQRTFREPLIYIESADKKPFSLTVRFPQGSPTSTFPPALTETAALHWPEVRFDDTLCPTAVSAGDRELVDDLGPAGADQLFVNGLGSRYLFYEGKVTLEPVLKVQALHHGLRVKNLSPSALSDVVLSQDFDEAGCQVAHCDRLEAGQELDLTWQSKVKQDYFPDLVAQGFKPVEAETFARFWRNGATGCQSGRNVLYAFYQLSSEACERMSTLDFVPKPQKITRALFVREEIQWQ